MAGLAATVSGRAVGFSGGDNQAMGTPNPAHTRDAGPHHGAEGPRAHAHHHNHATDALQAGGRLRWALGAVALMFAVEIAVGLHAHSLALVSDAGHLATDTASLGLAWFAISRSRRPASAEHTFGHHRAGILVAAVNGGVLLLVAVAIAAAAAARYRHPVDVDAAPVIAVASVALIINCGLAAMLGSTSGGLATRSAMLHVIGDALASAGVVASAVIILTTGWREVDAVTSLLIAAVIAASALRLLRDAGKILAESTPSDIDAERVHEMIAATPGIDGVHDLHIWSLSSDHRALSAHVIIGDRPLTEVTSMLQRLEVILCSTFNIEHATLQPECPSCLEEAPLYCDLDERHSLSHTPVRPPGQR